MPARSSLTADTSIMTNFTSQEAVPVSQTLAPETNQLAIPDETIDSVNKSKLANMKLMMRSFVQGALREKTQGNLARYNELVSSLSADPSQPSAPSPLKLHVWVTVLSQCVSHLDKSCASLVEAILKIDWAVHEQSFVDVYINFLDNLVSAHAFYVVPVINSLISGFKYRHLIPSHAKVTRTMVYERNHLAIRSIISLIPTCTNSLFVSMVRLIPHSRFSTADHAAYVKNILEVTDYAPVLRKQTLCLLVDHMVKIDSHIQIELDEIDEDVDFDTYHMKFDEEYESEGSDDESDDEEDDDDDDDGSVYSDDKGQDRSQHIDQVKSMVRKLDAMMLLVLRYISRCAAKDVPAVPAEIYHALLEVFDRTIIKTLKSRYTQFLLFYVSSLDVNTFSAGFLHHLIEHVTNHRRPNITRIASAAYISSYVARAKFLEPSTIQETLGILCTWCEQYVDQYDHTIVHLDALKHDVFYAVMQAIMYIFCFRWRDLVVDDLDASLLEEAGDAGVVVDSNLQPQGSRHWCRGLRNMPRLIMSRLNPLKVCSMAVVRQFAKLARSTRFMYVYPILEKNKDLLIAGINTSGTNEAKSLWHTVQSFFPFDPYRLEGSKSFIDSIYFEWIGEDDDDDEESDDESEDEGEEDEHDDTEMSGQFMAMSISPNPRMTTNDMIHL